MRNVLTESIVLLAALIGWRGVFQLSRAVRQTSLIAAARWAVWSQLTLTVAGIWPIVTNERALGIADQLWHLAAVSALCPLIAVLGARRGRLLDWSLFVIVPLVAVLEWPALAEWSRTWNGQRLELETPSVAAFGVVLVMGTGNFSGTRFALPVFWWAAACGLVSWSMRLVTDRGLWSRDAGQLLAAVFLLLCWWSANRCTNRTSTTSGWDGVWFDFRDYFGIVWANRLLARVNEVAEREQWPWRLTADGFKSASTDSTTGDPNADPRVGQTMRWLLKPFVDSEWIDGRPRMATDPPTVECHPKVAGRNP